MKNDKVWKILVLPHLKLCFVGMSSFYQLFPSMFTQLFIYMTGEKIFDSSVIHKFPVNVMMARIEGSSLIRAGAEQSFHRIISNIDHKIRIFLTVQSSLQQASVSKKKYN